ncbi:MAG: DUF1573 domain-containing protein [Duncaniella sp.]|nr:DUF1573 domain-containing protein [Duncaniella sp.]
MLRFSLIAAAALCAITSQAQVRWLEKIHDFGAFDEDLGTVYCDFKLVNEGTEPLAIVAARANCGCTRPTFSHEPVAPGDTAVVTVGFDPKGRPGKFEKNIYVETDAEHSRTTLKIRGTVIGAGNTLKSRYPVEAGPMRLRGTTVAYGPVIKDHSAVKSLEGYNASPDTLHPVITGAPKYINVICEPKTVPPGEQFVVSCILHSDLSNDWGLTTGSFGLAPQPGVAPVNVETVAIIKEDFSTLTPAQMDKRPVMTLSEPRIDLGHLDRSLKKITHTFKITNSGTDPLILRSVTCQDPAVTLDVSAVKIKKGKSARVTVTVDPSRLKPSAPLNTRISIIANDPVNPTEMIRLTGE